MKKQPVAFSNGSIRLIAVMALLLAMLLTMLPQVSGNFFAPMHAQAASSNPISVENSLPGTPGWNDFSSDLTPDTLSGFGSKISVNHGDSIDFYVTTTAASFTIDIFRTGYYGGVGARLITSLGSFPGVHQAIPAPDKVTGIVSCSNWSKTTTLNIPSGWVTGVYLAKLTSSTGKSSFIFFVVRDDGGHEAIDFQTSVTTYQAYNTWGGTSLYNNNTDLSIFKGAHATKVSFDRPFNPGDSNGAGHYFFYEYKFVYWMESQGYDVTYTSDVDTDTNVNPLTNHRAFLSVGHDEYWSAGMRNNVQAAINAGVNVAFFSANAMYWQIRFEANAAGVADRVEVGYKDFATDTTPPGPDPQWNVNNAIVTTNWRADPVDKPENALIGVMFEDQVNTSYPFVVQNAANWVYAGTGFVNGSSVPGIVGYEYDRVFNNGATPAGVTILGNSPVVGVSAGNSVSNATLYTAPSGARVFAAGTIQWSWGLANIQSNTYANAGIQHMTANILNNFMLGTGPVVALNPASVSFGNAIVGAKSAASTVTLSNSGSLPLGISNIAISGSNASDFSQTTTCPSGSNTLAAGSSCTISVTFTPGALGARSASLTISDNATDSPQSVALSGTGATAAPLVSLDATLLNFGNQNVASSSPAQSVTLTNTGTTPLGISSIALTGTNAADFSQTTTCPSSGTNTLAAKASCTISVTFTPTASGARSASLTFSDTAADSPQAVTLNGTGTVATTYFSDGFESGNLNAWNVQSSDSTGTRTVQSTVVNSGSNALAFNNASGQYSYVYTALSAGPQAQTFTRFYFRLGSTVSGGTELAIVRNSLGSNVWEMDYNANRHGLDLYFWSGSGIVYSVFSPNNVLSPGTWYEIEVQDYQASEGTAQAWLNGASLGMVDDVDLSTSNPYARLMLFDSAPGSIYFDDVAVSNVANGAITPSAGANLNPASVSFGNQIIGATSAASTVTLTNNHALGLSISSIGITGTNAADFAQTNTCPTGSNQLAAGSSCSISVTFTPGASGARSANLTFSDNAAGSPQSVALTGTGAAAAPVVSLSPASVSFGNASVGSSSAAQTVTLSNSGTTPLRISSIALTGTNAGDFAQSNTCPSSTNTLAAGSSCTISVIFTPGGNGARSANLTFTDTAADSPQVVALSGTGVTTTTYFSDGFESGNLNAWNLPSSDSTGTMSVQSAVVNSGSDALALNNASGQYSYVYTSLSSGPEAQTFTRFSFRFGSNVIGGTQLAIARNSNGGNVWEVDYNANRQGLDVYFWNASGGVYAVFSPNNALSANTWYSIQIQDYQTTTGHAQAWLNGTSLGSVDADLSTSAPYARLMLFDSAPGSIYLDDVSVSNT